MRIQETWRLLEEDSTSVPFGYLTRRLLPEVKYDVYLAIEKPNNTPLLMIRVKHSAVGKGTIFPTSNCFEVKRVALSNDTPVCITLQLVLTKPSYRDIFTTLVQDIVDCLALIIDDEKKAVFKFITRLQRWQKFLERHNSEGLSQTAQQGLYGELWFLRQIVIPQFGSCRGMQCWTGPKGTQQDFQFNQCAVEVKTTVTKQHQKLTISSERQLDKTGVAHLILLHLSLDSRQGSGESLPEIVARVRSLLVNDFIATEELETLLFEVGYLDVHSLRYEQIGYTQREINYFRVEGNFPKIIEADLPHGVGDVRYTINVDQCRPFSIPDFEVFTLIGG